MEFGLLTQRLEQAEHAVDLGLQLIAEQRLFVGGWKLSATTPTKRVASYRFLKRCRNAISRISNSPSRNSKLL
jgi:hypothetical protein